MRELERTITDGQGLQGGSVVMLNFGGPSRAFCLPCWVPSHQLWPRLPRQRRQRSTKKKKKKHQNKQLNRRTVTNLPHPSN